MGFLHVFAFSPLRRLRFWTDGVARREREWAEGVRRADSGRHQEAMAGRSGWRERAGIDFGCGDHMSMSELPRERGMVRVHTSGNTVGLEGCMHWGGL